jgi:hypothetical protein
VPTRTGKDRVFASVDHSVGVINHHLLRYDDRVKLGKPLPALRGKHNPGEADYFDSGFIIMQMIWNRRGLQVP